MGHNQATNLICTCEMSPRKKKNKKKKKKKKFPVNLKKRFFFLKTIQKSPNLKNKNFKISLGIF